MKLEEQQAIYERMHEEWLQHPMTKLALKAVDLHGEKHAEILTRDALNTNVADSSIRGIVISLQNTRAIKTLLSDIKQITKLNTKEKE